MKFCEKNLENFFNEKNLRTRNSCKIRLKNSYKTYLKALRNDLIKRSPFYLFRREILARFK